MTKRNLAASVRARLFNKANKDGVNFQRLLVRYALERLLYRLPPTKNLNDIRFSGSPTLTGDGSIHQIAVLIKHGKIRRSNRIEPRPSAGNFQNF